MYKSHFKAWGLTKYKRESDMRAIIHAHRDLLQQPKDRMIRVRDRKVKNQEVVRYWQRKGFSIDEVIAQKPAPVGVESFEVISPVTPPLSTPKAFALPEQMLFAVKAYILGSSQSETWSLLGDDSRELSIPAISRTTEIDNPEYELYYHCKTALELFKINNFRQGGYALISASAKIKGTLMQGNPRTLRYILHLTMHSFEAGRPEVALSVLRQLRALGAVIMGPNHPLPRICGWLTELEPSHMCHVLLLLEQMQVEMFENDVGPLHPNSLNAWSGLINTLDHLNETERAQRTLLDLISRCKSHFGPFALWTLGLRWTLGVHHLRSGKYGYALAVGESLIRDAQHLIPGNPPEDVEYRGKVYLRASGFEIAAHAQSGLHNLPAALTLIREAVDLQISCDVLTRAMPLLLQLEQWLIQDGQPGPAAEVRAKRLAMWSLEDMV